jgi:hypothetical protein
VVGPTSKAALLKGLKDDDVVTRNDAVPRKTEEKRSMRPLFDVLFLLAVLGTVISVYEFCPGQHMF